MRYYVLPLVWMACILPACSVDDSGNSEALPSGEDLFKKRHADGNTFACETCHLLAASDTLRPPGHPLGDAWSRPTYKNGALTSLFAAVNSCREEWMGAKAFTENQAEWQALETYLKEADEGKTGSNLSFTIASPPEDLTGGVPDTGKEIFAKTCGICHGSEAAGTDLGPAIAGTKLTAEKIAGRIRLSGSSSSPVYDGLTGGRMPFWSSERMTDEEIRHIIAWLSMTESTKITGAITDETDLSVTDARSSCGSDHAKVGQTTTLSTISHKVAGTATVVDNCTVKISGFYFDGGGIDVRIYSGSDQDFSAGKALTRNFLNEAFENGSVFFRLPAGVTLDEFDSISVWCVAVGVSFGHGKFE